MFVDNLQKDNPQLIKTTLKMFRDGILLPDTYVLDFDKIIENGKRMIEIAQPLNIKLFYMLKQIGRNPIIGKALEEIGFSGCVAVDYKEALTMIEHGCHLAHVGHLVQMPFNAMKKILSHHPDYVTVYSVEEIDQINKICNELNVTQKIVLRIIDSDSTLYSGQIGGFSSNDLSELIKNIEEMNNVVLGGLTVFPAFLYSEDESKIMPTSNMKAMNRARAICKEMGYDNLMFNLPSCTCCNNIALIAECHGNCGEPGHGLTGTTPLHKYTDQPEKIAYLYLSEISHNYGENAYCFGGGNYRRGHMENALVGYELKPAKVVAPDMESIDYHYEIKGNYQVGNPVIMAYRTQIFTTRSQVALIKGLSSDNPKLMGIYNSLGERQEITWYEGEL